MGKERKTRKTKKCAFDDKTIKKKLGWYYRSGEYFCKKNCWKKLREKRRVEKEEKIKAKEEKEKVGGNNEP